MKWNELTISKALVVSLTWVVKFATRGDITSSSKAKMVSVIYKPTQ